METDVINIETGSPHVFRFDNIMDADLCDELISYIINHTDKVQNATEEPYGVSFPYTIYPPKLKTKVEHYIEKVTNLISSLYGKSLKHDCAETLYWKIGTSMDFHPDAMPMENFSEERIQNEIGINSSIFTRVFTCITYLNDVDEGGETVVDRRLITDPPENDVSHFVSKPNKGCAVAYRTYCTHKVEEVKSNGRFTMAMFFVEDGKEI